MQITHGNGVLSIIRVICILFFYSYQELTLLFHPVFYSQFSTNSLAKLVQFIITTSIM